jgi:hypothetical protein
MIIRAMFLCSGAGGGPVAAHPAGLHARVRSAGAHARPRLHRARQRTATQGHYFKLYFYVRLTPRQARHFQFNISASSSAY